MALTTSDLARLAALARITLSAEESEKLAPQLDVILESVAQVAEVAADDIPPTSHALPLTNVFRADEVRPSLPVAGRAGRCPVGRAGPLPRAADPWGGVSDRCTPRQPTWPGRSHPGEASSVEVTQAHLDRIAAVDGQPCTRSCTWMPTGPSPPPRRSTPRSLPASRSARWRACRWRSRTCSDHTRCADDLRFQDPGELDPAVQRDGDPAAAGRRHRRSWARRTWTSSRWARRRRTPRTVRPTTRGT